MSNINRIYRLVKEGGWIIVGQTAAVLGMLVLVRVLTEYLDPERYGELALGMTLAMLVNQVVMGGVIAGIGRFYSIASEKQNLQGYLRASRQMLVYATLAVIIIGLTMVAGLIFLGYSQWVGLAVAALGFSVLSGYNTSLNGIQNAARQRSIVAFHGGMDAWLKILLAIAMIYWMGAISTSVVVGYALSSMIVTVSQLYFLRKLFISKVNAADDKSYEWKKKIWAFSRPFSVWGIFTWAQLSSDRWALEIFTTTQEVGLLAVLFQLGYYPISIVMGMAITFLAPVFYQRSGDAATPSRNANVHRLAWRITITSLVITAFAFSLGLLLHEWIFGILVSEKYRIISNFLPWMILSGGLFAAGQILSLKLLSEMKSSTLVRAKICTALLGIVFNLIGAYLLGLQGIVLSSIAFSTIYLIWMFMLTYRVAPLVQQTTH